MLNAGRRRLERSVRKRVRNLRRTMVSADHPLSRFAALNRLADGADRRLFAKQHPCVRRLGDAYAVRRSKDQLYIVRTVPGITPARAYEHNLRLVVDICDQAELDYFLITDHSSPRPRIGIPGRSWPRLIDALIQYAATAPLYVSRVDRVKGKPAKRSLLASTRGLGDRLRRQTYTEVFELISRVPGSDFLGRPYGCLIERWEEEQDGTISSSINNPVTTRIGPEYREPSELTHRSGVRARSYLPFSATNLLDISFPVDAVYMWVDGDDPAWQDRKIQALLDLGHRLSDVVGDLGQSANSSRFRDNGELRYSLRSLHQFAPWIRQVFLVTDRQVPDWLDPECDRLTVVDHTEIFADEGVLPTFNSHAIASRLHHIPGLADHFLILNDDVMFGRPNSPTMYFMANGISKFFLSRSTIPFLGADAATPHEQARRNVADLLYSDFGMLPTRNFFHTPVPQSRQLLFELEERYPDQFKQTWSNQFRASNDFEINGWLHHYYGFLQRRAIPGETRYSYFNLANESAHREMRSLIGTRTSDTLCLNDSPDATDDQRRRAGEWLNAYFPDASPFELDD